MHTTYVCDQLLVRVDGVLVFLGEELSHGERHRVGDDGDDDGVQ